MMFVIAKDEKSMIEHFMRHGIRTGSDLKAFYTSEPYKSSKGRNMTAGDLMVFVPYWTDGAFAPEVFDAVAPMLKGTGTSGL